MDYYRFSPVPFIWIHSVNIGKLRKTNFFFFFFKQSQLKNIFLLNVNIKREISRNIRQWESKNHWRGRNLRMEPLKIARAEKR